MALDTEAQKPHTVSYYKALGFVDYNAIDVNNLYGSLIMDLNVDLRERPMDTIKPSTWLPTMVQANISLTSLLYSKTCIS